MVRVRTQHASLCLRHPPDHHPKQNVPRARDGRADLEPRVALQLCVSQLVPNFAQITLPGRRVETGQPERVGPRAAGKRHVALLVARADRGVAAGSRAAPHHQVWTELNGPCTRCCLLRSQCCPVLFRRCLRRCLETRWPCCLGGVAACEPCLKLGGRCLWAVLRGCCIWTVLHGLGVWTCVGRAERLLHWAGCTECESESQKLLAINHCGVCGCATQTVGCQLTQKVGCELRPQTRQPTRRQPHTKGLV